VYDHAIVVTVTHDAPPVPRKIDVKKSERLRIEWADGTQSVFPISLLRQMCPCAACRALRTGTDPHQLMRPANEDDPAAQGPSRRALSLNVLPKHFASESDEVQVTSADLVGNYAIQLTFSDGHTSGIFSFVYLRDIAE
jgi:DUF971 family protein